MHLVTRVHFRSRDKDGGYTIRSAVPENPMLHANITALRLQNTSKIVWLGSMFYRTGVLAECRSKFHIAGIGILYLFGSCDLELDPMTFIYELDL